MNKEFLEEYPLFRRFVMNVPKYLNSINKTPINMICNNCGDNQTFNMVNEYWEFHRIMNTQSMNEKVRLFYQCQSCKIFYRQFNVYISPNLDYVYKFGQYPEWEIKIDKNLDRILGKHSKTYRKGLVCESQSYGIAAFAYYRKITEEIIDELLDSITELIEEEDKIQFSVALQKTKETRIAQEKIELVKDLLPKILKPNGVNPLGILHSQLSEGLHAESDEKCLENASHIKDILIFLLNQISISKESAKLFTESMKTLLEKKNKK
jgi:hypothetical protein